MAVLGLYCCMQPFSSCSAWASHCSGFPCGVQTLGMQASEFVACQLSSLAHGSEHSLSSCGTWASFSCAMWDPPVPGIELMFPALAGRFFTTEPSGRPPN